MYGIISVTEPPVSISGGDTDQHDGDASSNAASGTNELTGAMKTLLQTYLEDNEFLGMFTALVSQAQSGSTSDAVRDTVSLVTICLTILGSILAIIRLFSRYILPANEEQSMHSLMKTIQQNDFDHEMVLLLKNNGSDSNTILSYLTLRNQRLNASGQNGSGSAGDNEGQGGNGSPGGENATQNDNQKGNQNGAQNGDQRGDVKEENGQP